MLLRLALIEGPTFAVLFEGDLDYQTKISHLYQSTNLVIKDAYLDIATTKGYLISLIIFLTIFRVSFLPLDLFIIKRQIIKDGLTNKISLIRSNVSDFKEQSKQVRECYVSNGINTKHDVILLTFKILLMLFVFSVVFNGVSLEPQNWQNSRGFINGFLGTLLFPLIYFSNRFQPQISRTNMMAIGLPLILYVCSIALFSVSLLIFILIMQAFNLLGSLIGNYFFVTMVNRKNYEEVYS